MVRELDSQNAPIVPDHPEACGLACSLAVCFIPCGVLQASLGRDLEHRDEKTFDEGLLNALVYKVGPARGVIWTPDHSPICWMSSLRASSNLSRRLGSSSILSTI